MSNMFYTKEDFIAAIHAAGVNKGDLVMVHTGMSSLRAMPKGIRSQQELSAFCAECLLEAVGEDGTLVVPSFTYSLGSGDVYDAATTLTKDIGEFPAYFWKLPGVRRNNDPFLAVAAKGPLAKRVLQERSRTSYGYGSFFDNFCMAGGKLLTIGVGMRWATIRYHFAEIAHAPFRYLKVFYGQRKVNGHNESVTWEYSVAPRAEKADKISRQLGFYVEDDMVVNGLVQRAALGRGYVSCIEAQSYRAYIIDLVSRDPWIVGGDIDSKEEIIKAELERTGKKDYEIELKDNIIEEIGNKIADLPRYPFSDAYNASIFALANRFPLKIEKVSTGTKLGDWVVPERWVVRSATVATTDGKLLLDTKTSPLLIATQSRSFSGEVSKEELLRHIYLPDKSVREQYSSAVPYVYRDIERTWGLCLSDKDRRKLTANIYKVEIDTDFSYSQAHIADWYLEGESEATILLAAYMDSPCQFNTGLSGAIAGLKLMEQLSLRKSRQYSYRLLILPWQFGISGWQALHPELADKVVGGIAFDNFAVADRTIALHIPYGLEINCLAKAGENEGIEICYGENISKDWQNFLGVNTGMPIYLVQRDSYDASHTTADNWKNADRKQLLDGISAMEAMLTNLEHMQV